MHFQDLCCHGPKQKTNKQTKIDITTKGKKIKKNLFPAETEVLSLYKTSKERSHLKQLESVVLLVSYP